MNYNHISHTHCWAQKQPSACGIPLERHTQCCLCDLPVPKEERASESNYDRLMCAHKELDERWKKGLDVTAFAAITAPEPRTESWESPLTTLSGENKITSILVGDDRFVSESKLRGVVEGMKENKAYKAMVESGDLSFGRYTPTQIYNKALDDILKALN